MGHILKKRTIFKKGNFKINRTEAYVFGRVHGYYLPSKLYMQFQIPYYYQNKTTVFQTKCYNYRNKKYWLDYL